MPPTVLRFVMLSCLLLASCGGTSPPVLVLPTVKPIPNAAPTKAGTVSLGIVREIPYYKLVKRTSLSVTPFMGGGNQKAVPDTLKAPVGSVFVVIAFTDQPAPKAGKMDISIQCGSEVWFPNFECYKFYAQGSGAEFDPQHSFREIGPNRTQTVFSHPPFAVAFQIDVRNTSNGTLLIDGQKIPIEWK